MPNPPLTPPPPPTHTHTHTHTHTLPPHPTQWQNSALLNIVNLCEILSKKLVSVRVVYSCLSVRSVIDLGNASALNRQQAIICTGDGSVKQRIFAAQEWDELTNTRVTIMAHHVCFSENTIDLYQICLPIRVVRYQSRLDDTYSPYWSKKTLFITEQGTATITLSSW